MKPDVYQMVTDKILAMLDEGVVPWHKPWTTTGPINAVSGKAYRGINVWLLGMAPYSDTRWITFKNAKALGGSVKTGEKGTMVVFWNWIKKNEGTPEETSVAFLKYYIQYIT